MADGDIVIADSATEAAPHEYVVKGSEFFAIKQVQALFTDNGAGGAWLPTLEIVAPPGIVTGRYVGTSVAAGSDQEVTFFPLGSKGAAAAASTISYAVYTGTGPAGGNQHWGSVVTNDTATFSIDGTDNTLAVVSTQGVYLVILVMTLSVLTSPYTIPANSFVTAVETASGADVVQMTALIKGQTDATLTHAGAEFQTASELFPRSVLAAPFKIRASHSPVDANLGIGKVLRFVKIA